MLPRLFTALVTLALVSSPSIGLEIRTYTASELGFLASSHLVLGQEEALLVDAQFTRSDAYEVVRLVKSSERRLGAIFITHGRPEHFLGLEVLVENFPEARVLARPATVEAVLENGQDAVERWQPIYLDDVASRVVVPEPFEEEAFRLEGVEIRILDFAPEDGPAPAGHPTALFIPSEETLLASDLAFDEVHLWLAEADLGRWSESLEALRQLEGVTWVYPGHGKGGGPGLLAASAEYLATLTAALATSGEPSQVILTLKKAYPGYRLPIVLEQSVKAARGAAKKGAR